MPEKSRTKKPKITGTIEIEQEVDFTEALDFWTVEEIEGYINGHDDGAGRDSLMTDSYVIATDQRGVVAFDQPMERYLAWRKENGLTGRKLADEQLGGWQDD